MINKIHKEENWKSNHIRIRLTNGFRTGRGGGGGCSSGNCAQDGSPLWDSCRIDEATGRGLGRGHHYGAGTLNGVSPEYADPEQSAEWG